MTMALTQVNSNGISDNSIVNADINSAANIASTKLAKPIDLADAEKVRLGTDGDLNIQHSGSNSFVETSNSSTGDLYIISNGASHDLYLQANDDVLIRCADGENGIRVLGNSAVELYHNNIKKLETKSDGISVAGEVECTFLDLNGNADISGNLTVGGLSTMSGNIDLQDGDQILIGTDDDLRLYHADSNSSINNYNGGLFIQNYSDDQDITIKTDNGSGGIANYIVCDGSAGAVRLYNYGSEKLTTLSSGVDITGELRCDNLDVDGVVDIDKSSSSEITSIDSLVSGGGNNKVAIKSGANQGGDPYIFFDAGGTNFVVGEQYNGGTSNILRLGAGNNMATVLGMFITADGHCKPDANNARDLGDSSNRWRNVYTNDLNLSNEGSTNDIDGTWGSFTIQEGEDDLFLINRRSGKKYKFNLTEVN